MRARSRRSRSETSRKVEIPHETPYERGFPGHVRRDPRSGDWLDDPWILDERWLGVHVRGAGVVVFSACSHAGIVNVVRHVARVFAPLPIHAIVGGFHLAGPAQEVIVDRTVEDLARFSLARVVPGHCTGWRAIHRLVDAFGDTVTPSAVGQVHRFE
jgi:7,8-dihydropterin-6-yl-methyl-4-(beta-D-ribofuranosyl)aminobenzene 5'-phosphate synthase